MALKHKIETYRVSTGMGKIYNNPLTFLTEKEKEELDNIGYSGKTLGGKKMSREAYLNSLGKGTFAVTRIRPDKGDFSEEFIITRTVEKELNKSQIQFCVTFTFYRKGKLESNYNNFEDEKKALSFFEKLLIDPELYTANFCKVIETTG